jgi:hypothetical protein
VEGDRELERITEETLDLSGEELISRKNLEYLKSTKEDAADVPVQPTRLKHSEPKPPTGKNYR